MLGVRGEEFGGYLFSFFFLLFISSFIFIAHQPVTFGLSAQCICSNLYAPFQGAMIKALNQLLLSLY